MNAAPLLLARVALGIALLTGGCQREADPGPAPQPTPPKATPAREVAEENTPRPSHVVLVSFDGARPDFVQEARMPTFHAMAREGAVTWAARSIVPPFTLPAHTSMLTGLAPEEHRVYWNQWIPAFGPLRSQTIFMLAKSNGLSCAAFSGKDKLAHLFPTGSVDRVSFPLTDPRDWTGTNVFSARHVAAQAMSYFAEHKPRLMFVHFPDVDMAGHFYGWPSPEQFSALAECDAALAQLRTGIERVGGTNTVFILTADHGGAGLHHGLDRPEDMTIPWVIWGAGVRPGVVLSAPVTLPDTAATVAWLFGFALPTNAVGRPVLESFRQTSGAR